MATITTDTFLDGGTAVGNTEAWIMNNGSTLTVRTDTRVHANAAAGFTGLLGSISLNSPNAKIMFDGTKVRWLKYTGGSGTVPTAGTLITQGGVTGYFLGLWTQVGAAPTAYGATMPGTGYLKFREVTGGTFSAGALTGITANADGADVTGWIEVTMLSTNIIGHLTHTGGVISRGDWFYLDSTTGVRGQYIYTPTTASSGAGVLIPAVQIETAPGSGVFEWWGGVNTSNFLTTTVSTDGRGKLFQNSTVGIIIGYSTNSGANAGFLPPAGCRVRIPNVIIRQASSGTPTVNTAAPTNINLRPGLSQATTVGTKLDLEYMITDVGLNCGDATSISMKYSAWDSPAFSTVSVQNPIILTDSCSSNLNSSSFTAINGLISGGVFNKVKFVNWNTSALQIQHSSNLTINDGEHVIVNAGTGSINGLMLNGCDNINVNNITTIGGGLSFTTCKKVFVDGYDYTSTPAGTTNATRTGPTPITISASGDITINNISFGKKGTLASANPYSHFTAINSNTGPVNITNAGTAAVPLPCDSSFAPGYLGVSSPVTLTPGVSFKRVYLSSLRTGYWQAPGKLIRGFNIQNVGTGYGLTFNGTFGSDTVMKGIVGTVGAVVTGGINGQVGYDGFSSTTQGYMYFICCPTSAMSSDFVKIYPVTPAQPTAYLSSVGGLYLANVGDYATFEFMYFAKGHTGFQNAAPVIQANTPANQSYQYQIDTGGGWNGIWKAATGANLSAETINPNVGFKIKLKITCITAGASNSIMAVRFLTTTTAEAQAANLYPLDTVSLGFTNLIPGSEVRVYAGTDPATAVEIGGTEATAGSTFSFTHSSSGVDGVIAIFALGYQPIYLPYTFKTTDDSILIQQVIDRNYVNP